MRVTLLDRRNHHLFQPLLYQVATATLNASDIAAPLRSVLRRARNVTVLLAEVGRVDLAARRLQLDRGELAYDSGVAERRHPEVLVIGDMSLCRDEKGAQLPGLAPGAIQEGRRAADNVLQHLSGRPTRPFRYRDRGTMATIGRAKAVAVISGVKLSGLVAWLAWLFVHIMFLIGFRNRFLVLSEWAWAYLTWQRGARLITGPWHRPDQRAPRNATKSDSS